MKPIIDEGAHKAGLAFMGSAFLYGASASYPILLSGALSGAAGHSVIDAVSPYIAKFEGSYNTVSNTCRNLIGAKSIDRKFDAFFNEVKKNAPIAYNVACTGFRALLGGVSIALALGCLSTALALLIGSVSLTFPYVSTTLFVMLGAFVVSMSPVCLQAILDNKDWTNVKNLFDSIINSLKKDFYAAFQIACGYSIADSASPPAAPMSEQIFTEKVTALLKSNGLASDKNHGQIVNFIKGLWLNYESTTKT